MSQAATQDNDLLDAVFAALADPTRRAMLGRLARGEVSVSELAKPFNLSQPAITKHLKVLERAGLVNRSRRGQQRPAVLNPERLDEASRCLEAYRQIWEANFSRLDQLLAEGELPSPPDDPA
ncbi:MAG: metalloregulator ArsR/SmtB family transcription factor [Natronospirillum sp.]|uniref:ArsR/SmtB family transcription factor n=1 Tax=Natronospirillum sp. TaxID=2812955 RepID=UPI0025EBBA47|nr:metalloregulator ArsR/SmtB family transcription factor [Natronospirillum sp.]MCH8552897.1 metalloregulator ArsR/SmtB family transcription factor [Natronospirillum sp.]